MEDLSRNWNCKVVGGEDLPVEGVTKRIDDGVEEVGECRIDDPRVLFGLSGCVSARERQKQIYDRPIQWKITYKAIISSQWRQDLLY